ncbi:MAG: heavy metal translocating P-type ATPase, partial [Deltaproteobacteria bacterium]|nr:heavy metal translocating P-type ATPase [Deltaproteobacteria bacterium]
MTVLSNLQKKQAPGAAVPASCLHCGSPCRNAESSYCCAGCEFVYRTINSLGLSGFYRLRESGEKARASEIKPEKKFEYLDEPTVIASMVSSDTHGDCVVRFYLPTIHCAACVWLLEKLPQVLHGVSTARVSFRSGIIEVGYRPSEIRLSELARVLNSIGYPPVPATHDATEAQLQKEDRAMLRRIGVAAVCATNTMMLADSLVQGGVTGIDEPYRQLLTWTSAAFALPAVVYSALPFYRAAFGAIIMGSLHIDIPISIAIVVSYAAGIYHALQGDSLVYFDSITCLIFLLLLARFAQQRALHKARASTLSAWDLFPGTVRVQSAQDFTEKPFRELKVGDVVEVRANERIPSDGIVVSGVSTVEASFLNGESLPQEVHAGMAVLGASVNIERPILVRVEALGERTRLGQILSKVELARDKRSPLENRIQRIANIFVAATLVAACAAGLIWYWIDSARAFDIVIAFLVVTCPCALGLAIPTAVTVALSRAQKSGIFIKKSEALQTLAEAQHFYFDKTGTLTEGRLCVKSMVGTESHRALAVALARVAAAHPVSQAILELGSGEPLPV